MFEDGQYELLDFGKGRKLERFGEFVFDRPCPAADRDKHVTPSAWKSADFKYERKSESKGVWRPRDVPDPWRIENNGITFELRPTEFGHVGIFPEQVGNWDWIRKVVERNDRPLKVLNLFAYTGGSTLAAAIAGAEVTHVDSSKSAVMWAKRNAELSGLDDAPIRWIVEDCQKFVNRELRRGNSYDALILDPPSYGHGPKGETWKLTRDLMPLLANCAELTSSSPRAFLLLTCHSPGFGAPELSACLEDTFFGHCQTGAKASRLTIRTVDARKLDAGAVARWPS